MAVIPPFSKNYDINTTEQDVIAGSDCRTIKVKEEDGQATDSFYVKHSALSEFVLYPPGAEVSIQTIRGYRFVAGQATGAKIKSFSIVVPIIQVESDDN